jgi:hypothetical protein
MIKVNVCFKQESQFGGVRKMKSVPRIGDNIEVSSATFRSYHYKVTQVLWLDKGRHADVEIVVEDGEVV